MGKNKTGKRKTFELEQQVELLPEGGVSELQRIAEEDEQVIEWALIVHDKDEAEPHVHMLLRMKSSTTYETVAKKFGVPVQCINKIKSTFGQALCYLTHCKGKERAKGKYLYEDEDVIANYDWQYERNKALDKTKEGMSDKKTLLLLAGGNLRLCDVDELISDEQQLRIGKNRLQYADEIRQNKMDYNCDQQTVLIIGESGVGKTTLAKYLAGQAGQGKYYMSGSEKDIWEFYRGERVAILDDFRPQHMTLTEFLRLADPYTASPVHSRYHSKRPTLDLLIITTILPLEDFLKGFQGAEGEDPTQARRRLQKIIRLEPGVMYVTENGKTEPQNFVLSDFFPARG